MRTGLDFGALQTAEADGELLPTPGIVVGECGVNRSFETHGPPRDARDVLILYQGGGANRRAGYGA